MWHIEDNIFNSKHLFTAGHNLITVRIDVDEGVINRTVDHRTPIIKDAGEYKKITTNVIPNTRYAYWLCLTQEY